jgi:hypothetical protein
MSHPARRLQHAIRPLHRGLAALAIVLGGAMALALPMDPAQAVVDARAVTLVRADAGPASVAPAASGSARATAV